MTIEEAEKIAKIAGTADGGCSSCVGGICERLNDAAFGFVFTPTDEAQPPEPYDEYDTDPEDWRSYGVVVRVDLFGE